MSSYGLATIYVTGWLVAMGTFSYFWRRKGKSFKAEPWFGQHHERNEYITLLSKDAPDNHLKAALLRRATEDLRRVLRLREDKQALSQLLRNGAVGDDLWAQVLATEQEMNQELQEVVEEANALHEGWGEMIFQHANEIVQHERVKALQQESAELLAREERESKTREERDKRDAAEAEKRDKLKRERDAKSAEQELLRMEEVEKKKKSSGGKGGKKGKK
ncbi:uncharacterized protein VTP21DRAFT_6836 [Calcarisporiella thermophila]|uniref:uncharacterized protein n=1 Tax=Calcarisporiella thermophila TaxID=911321 RepID=UPI0037428DE1